MIPHDHIAIDGAVTPLLKVLNRVHLDRAWWVVPADQLAASTALIDRPCDACGGDCEDGPNYHTPIAWHCPDCDGTGRHTFEVEVANPDRPDGWPFPGRTLRVSVVPDMVLPIVGGVIAGDCIDHIGNIWEYGVDREGDPEWTLIDHAALPPAARPGMYAVQLAVHS